MDTRLAVTLARPRARLRMNGFYGDMVSFGDNVDFCTKAALVWAQVFPGEAHDTVDKYWMLCQSPLGGDPNTAFGKGARRLPINWSADPNFVADVTGAIAAGGGLYGTGAVGAKSEPDLLLSVTAQGVQWANAPMAQKDAADAATVNAALAKVQAQLDASVAQAKQAIAAQAAAASAADLAKNLARPLGVARVVPTVNTFVLAPQDQAAAQASKDAYAAAQAAAIAAANPSSSGLLIGLAGAALLAFKFLR